MCNHLTNIFFAAILFYHHLDCMAIDAFGTVAGLKSQRSLRALQKRQKNSDPSGLNTNATSLDNSADCAAEDLSKAESILRYMHDLSEAGDIDVSPTTDAYNTYIAGFARTANEFNPKHPSRRRACSAK